MTRISMVKTKVKQDGVMASLLSSEGTLAIPKPGELVRGKVIVVGKNEILVDLDGVLTGVARGAELEDEMGMYSNMKIGDEVEGKVIDIDNENGHIELSFRSASHQKAWNALSELRRTGENISVDVIGANKGGLIVKLHNVVGFLPVSQLAAKNYPRVEGNKSKILEKLQSFVGHPIMVKVIDVSETEEKLIVSEKEAEADLRLSSLQKYHVGDVVDVVVKGVVDFGVFVEFGEEFEGLIHVSELSWRTVNPHEVWRVGDTLKAQIVNINRGRVALSVRRLGPNPWLEELLKLETGSTLPAMVVRHEGRGVIVEPFPGFETYVDVQGNEAFADGTTHTFLVVESNPQEARLVLSLPPPPPLPQSPPVATSLSTDT